MIVATLLACAAEPPAKLRPADPVTPSVCDVDEVFVDIPAGGGLDTLDASEAVAAELLGEDPIWRGDLQGLVLDLDGHPMGDGSIPAFGDGEASLVPVGWTTTWCAGGGEVTITAGRTEQVAVCEPTEACGDDLDERPIVDADFALRTAVPEDNESYLYAVLSQSGEVSDTPFWTVLWHDEAGQPYAAVDARTGEILDCPEGLSERCRDLSSL